MSHAPAQAARVASTDEIRAAFPALNRQHGGHPVAYFDGPGGTQVPRVVVDAMADYLLHHNANTHWDFPTSHETDALVADARVAAADFLNASPDEVAFGNNMTSLTFHVARALGRRFGPGDEVVVTELDHHANVDPWLDMARERGLTVRTARMIPETGQIDWDDLERQMSAKTKLLALGAASNAIGTINDVGRGVKLAHDHGAIAFVDAVHYAPHRLVDVRAWDCDFLACSAYKFHGPHAGLLFGRGDLLAGLDVPKLRPSPDNAPDRIETGTGNFEAMAGTAAAIDYLAGLADGDDRRSRLLSSFEALHDRGERLVEQLWSGLAAIPGVRTFGPPPGEPRTPTVSFALAGTPAQDVCRTLAGRGLFASHGHFYAETAVDRLGQARDGLVRVGCACYTTPDEVDRLLDVVASIGRGR